MPFIIVAIQETGEEAVLSNRYPDRQSAYEALSQARENYPEWRNFQVEELRDKDYYMWRDEDE